MIFEQFILMGNLLKKFVFCSIVLFSLSGCFLDKILGKDDEKDDEKDNGNQSVVVDPFSNVLLAISKVDHLYATKDEFIEFSLELIKNARTVQSINIKDFYNNVDDNISWDPTGNSVYFLDSIPDINLPILKANQTSDLSLTDKNLIMRGEQNDHYYIAMGANIFTVNLNNQTIELGKKIIQWIKTNKAITNRPIKILTTGIPSSTHNYAHNEDLRSWLNTNLSGNFEINTAHDCDDELLLSCLTNTSPDLVIMSQLDENNKGFTVISEAFNNIVTNKIPIIAFNYTSDTNNRLSRVYDYMKVSAKSNVDLAQASNYPIGDLKNVLVNIENLLNKFKTENFNSDASTNCTENFILCETQEFEQEFKLGADWYRALTILMDRQNLDVFTLDGYNLLKVGLLLADKYRGAIDYPIENSNTFEWYQALFADWVINYSRESNQPQHDLGNYIASSDLVEKGNDLNYTYPVTLDENKTFSIKSSGQWTTTGWYALPGQKVTLTRTDSNANLETQIKLYYGRENTNRSYETKILLRPQELMTQRLILSANKSVSFTSPYGAPIYLYIEGSANLYNVKINASGVTHHPSVTQYLDPSQLSVFESLLETEIPHIDFKTPLLEMHFRKDKFMSALGGSYPTSVGLFEALIKQKISPLYGLAGYKLIGESQPSKILNICAHAFGFDSTSVDCSQDNLAIQHINYDENANCGDICPGNPVDTNQIVSPNSWQENENLAKSMQVKQLDLHFVSETNRNDWSTYVNRSQENSHLIFPYFMNWYQHYVIDKNTTPLANNVTNSKDVFYAFISDIANLQGNSNNKVVVDSQCNIMEPGDTRFTAPWENEQIGIYNSFRFNFYVQMAFIADAITMSNSEFLSNGFQIFSLLYIHQRLFEKYSKNEALWNANKENLGFSEFLYSGDNLYGGGNITNIPGNDFLIISLSKITGQNWEALFDIFGLQFSDLAIDQVVINSSRYIPFGIYPLEQTLPPVDMSTGIPSLRLDVQNPNMLWPVDNSSTPLNCSF